MRSLLVLEGHLLDPLHEIPLVLKGHLLDPLQNAGHLCDPVPWQ